MSREASTMFVSGTIPATPRPRVTVKLRDCRYHITIDSGDIHHRRRLVRLMLAAIINDGILDIDTFELELYPVKPTPQDDELAAKRDDERCR